MNDVLGRDSPVRLKALVGLPVAVYASVLAKDDMLEIVAPFGEVIVPYGRIAKATKDVNGVISLDMAGGVTITLEVITPSYRDTVFVLLQQKIMKPGGNPTSSPGR